MYCGVQRMIERTVEQHLECAFNIMRGFDIKEEKNYWDVMSHIHDASMILKNKPERSRYDWIDWCTCDQRQRELEEWREKRQKDLRLQ